MLHAHEHLFHVSIARIVVCSIRAYDVKVKLLLLETDSGRVPTTELAQRRKEVFSTQEKLLTVINRYRRAPPPYVP